jgi:NADH-quinone oxidoreductase subunit F
MENDQLETIAVSYEGRSRDALLPFLWDVQTAFGHIFPEAVRLISHTLRVPEADIYGVISFYELFHEKPTGETIIRICTDPSCWLRGADDRLRELCAALGLAGPGSTADGRYTVEASSCIGLCEHAPAALISQRGRGETAHAPMGRTGDLLRGPVQPPPAVVGGNPLVLLQGIGGGDPESLQRYGQYEALSRAVTEMTPEDVIDQVKDARLLGRGGAAFPTGVKWAGVRANLNSDPTSVHYVICNADESEPGTFKDRVLMEERPHLLLEGMALCAYAVGAQQGYIFVRGEYPTALARLQHAITEAQAAGLLGSNILGSAFSFHVEIRRGAGAYICGEETALFEAMEGGRGFPRMKPPYPTVYGLFGRPTAVGNVETLCAVPGIIQHGAAWFRQWGTEQSTGTKLVSVSGHVRRPGVYEISPGITLRTLLEDHCGGIDGSVQAVLMGGASGALLTPDELDVRLTFEDLRAAGSTFGSGAIMVFNDTVDLYELLRRVARFFKHESCGKCLPCQLGTKRQLDILQRMETPYPGDRERLLDIGRTMAEASLCGLGQTAASAVLSALSKWPMLLPAEEGA